MRLGVASSLRDQAIALTREFAVRPAPIQIESSFGVFEANSDAELRIRVAEVDAIARLEEVSQSEQFWRDITRRFGFAFTPVDWRR